MHWQTQSLPLELAKRLDSRFSTPRLDSFADSGFNVGIGLVPAFVIQKLLRMCEIAGVGRGFCSQIPKLKIQP